jgi:subtilisin family serine protease
VTLGASSISHHPGSVAAQVEITGLSSTHPEVVRALGRIHSASFIAELAELAPERSSRFAALGANSANAEQTARVFWSPPRRLLLDHATASVHLPRYREQARQAGMSAATGAGVAIGIVDSGVDFAHPDLQNPDGTTRVAWFIDFADTPLGIYPELETRFGCTSEEADTTCAVLSSVEINTLVRGLSVSSADGSRVRLALDRLGHGTHVASLAAGNGAADSRYAGIAPEATLIVARVASVTTAVSDTGVLVATEFVYDRADEMGMPAVVNLSLGGDFGPHDGSSSIGRALADLANRPGRAMVVAAGNSAALLTSDSLPYPGPFGVHTEVHVPKDGSVRVPLLLPRGHGTLTGSFFVWIGAREQDSLSVGLERADGSSLTGAIAPGEAALSQDGPREWIAVNRVSAEDVPGAEDLERGAALVVSGEFDAGSVFAVRLEGSGNAQLWVQSEGDLSPEISEGVLLPGALRDGTITIPAVSPELLAVGATVNRLSWPSREDGQAALFDIGTELDQQLESPAFFSSHGPNQLGQMKPDILAPGVAVAAAMATAADPLIDGDVNPLSIFGATPVCLESVACSVVSDRYAVTLGTSMASPIVAGAVALLLEEEPSLDQAELMRLVHAGSRRLPVASRWIAQAEPGLLDIAASQRALLAQSANIELDAPSSSHSWLALSDGLARPDPNWSLLGRLHLRDAGGDLADAELNDLDVDLTHGRLLGRPRQPAPGLVEFEFAADAGSAGRELRLEVRHLGRLLTTRTLPIALDPNIAKRGVSVQGGCAIAAEAFRAASLDLRHTSSSLVAWVLGGALWCWARRRHGSSAKYSV